MNASMDSEGGPGPVSVSEEAGWRLAQCGLRLEDGCLGYSRTSTVKPAVMLSDGTKVAVKLFHVTHRKSSHDVPSIRQSVRPPVISPEEIAEYAREMNIAAGVDMNHPHLLRILSFSEVPRDWICCERFDANLMSYIRATTPWRARSEYFVRVLSPIGDAVDFLHAKNYVHKDIHSGHILVLRDFSRVVLTGLKLSKSLTDDGTFFSSAKRGQIQWMDPECFDRNYAFESDVYSLGVVLGELLTGKQPFHGEGHGVVITLKMRGEPPFSFSRDIRARWRQTCELYDRATAVRIAEPEVSNAKRPARPRAREFVRDLLRAVKADDNRRTREQRRAEREMDEAEARAWDDAEGGRWGMGGGAKGDDGKCAVQ